MSIQESEWLQLKQVWMALGPNRDLRTLQRHIERKHRVKVPLDELRMEVNKRGWTFEVIEYDSKVNQRVDALTIDNLAKEIAAERINGWRTLRDQAREFSDLLTLLLPKVRKHLESKSTVSLDELRRFMETALKVREFMDNQEVPLLAVEDDAAIGVDFSNPAELSRALLNIGRIRDLGVDDLTDLQERGNGAQT